MIEYKLHVKGWPWCSARGSYVYDLSEEQAQAMIRDRVIPRGLCGDFESIDWWELERVKTTVDTTLLASSED